MTKKLAQPPLALTAIAAALAAVPTLAVAQAAPAADAPAASAAVPATVAAPAADPAAPVSSTVSTPVIQPVPRSVEAPTTVAEPAPAPETTTRTVRTTAAAPVRATTTGSHATTARAPAAAAPAAGPIVARPAAAPAAAAPVAAPAALPMERPLTTAAVNQPQPAPAPMVAETDRSDGETALGLGLVGLLALGGIGAYAARRRRVNRAIVEDYVETDHATTVAAPALTVPAPEEAREEPHAAPRLEPAAATSAAALATTTVPQPEAAPIRGEAVTIPPGPLPTNSAARKALLDRLVAAAPDESNPFVSRKRRLRRAQNLMRDHELALREKATQPFDFRTYRPFSQTEGEGELAPNSTATPV